MGTLTLKLKRFINSMVDESLRNRRELHVIP
jgi:hypothetical protein